MNNATPHSNIRILFSGETDENKFDSIFVFNSEQKNEILETLTNLLASKGLLHKSDASYPISRFEVVVPRRRTPEDTQTAFGEQYKQILQEAIELTTTSVTTAFSVLFLNSEQEEMSSLTFSKEGKCDAERAEFVQWLYGAGHTMMTMTMTMMTMTLRRRQVGITSPQ